MNTEFLGFDHLVIFFPATETLAAKQIELTQKETEAVLEMISFWRSNKASEVKITCNNQTAKLICLNKEPQKIRIEKEIVLGANF